MDDGLREENASLMESDAKWSKVAAKQNEVMERSKKLCVENMSLRSQNNTLLQTIEGLSSVAASQSNVINERGRLYERLLVMYRETREELDEMLAARAAVPSRKVHKRRQPARKVQRSAASSVLASLASSRRRASLRRWSARTCRS